MGELQSCSTCVHCVCCDQQSHYVNMYNSDSLGIRFETPTHVHVHLNVGNHLITCSWLMTQHIQNKHAHSANINTLVHVVNVHRTLRTLSSTHNYTVYVLAS